MPGKQGSQTNVSLESQRHIDADHRHGLFCPEIKRPSIEVAIVADFGANHDDIVNLLIPAYAAVYSIQRRISAELNRQVRASKSCKKDLRNGAAGAMTEWSVDNERWYAVLGGIRMQGWSQVCPLPRFIRAINRSVTSDRFCFGPSS